MAASIEFKYTLQKEDILKAMTKSGYYKHLGVRRIIEICILIVFFFIFGISYFTMGYDIFNLFMAIVCLVFLMVVLVVPRANMVAKTARMAEGKNFSMRVSPSKITVENGEEEWAIPLDNSARCKLIENRIIAIMTAEKQLVVLPVAAIPKDQSTQVQTMIYEGTEAY